MRALRRSSRAFAALLLAANGTACAPGEGQYGGPWLAREDLRLLTPQLYVPVPRAHPLNDTVGWAYLLTYESASQINTWTLRSLERLEPLVLAARKDEGFRLEDGRRAWGPYEDPEGRELEWRVAELEQAEGLTLEVWDPQRDRWRRYVHAEVQSDETGRRRGVFRLEAGLAQALPELGYHLHDTIREYTGTLELSFERSAELHRVEIEWSDFAAVDTGLEGMSFRVGGPLHYARTPDGAGQIDYWRAGTFDDVGFTDGALDRMQIELLWSAAPESMEPGFARARIADDEAQNPGGDPVAGPLEIQECFDAAGDLVWRRITPAYLEVQPDYEKGELAQCAGASPWPPLE